MPPLEEQLAKKLDLSKSILTPAGKTQLRWIIRKLHQAFAAEDGLIGKYNGSYRHRIDLVAGSKPFQLRPYRTPLALREEIERQVKDMLKQRIIKPSNSPFCSPVVLVKKASGAWRFAVDYRRLNSITVKETATLPRIDDIIDLVAGHKYYSSFDLMSGFHQIPVHPEHTQYTAFATHLGLFEFLQLPFGVCNGPASFQRVMESLRREMSATVLIYLDDIVVSSDTEEKHLKDIEEFLRVIIKYNMKLRLDKCTLGSDEIKYLGFLVSQKGVRPDPGNIINVKSIKQPKTITELRSFIGAASYYRRFIQNFAGIMQPLYALTKKDASVTLWKEEPH
ncbi:retroelement [Aphelenchoides avenae]|nr:retroelement [Aphelenchus avenae]